MGPFLFYIIWLQEGSVSYETLSDNVRNKLLYLEISEPLFLPCKNY